MSAPDLAEPQGRLDRALAAVPRALSSHQHVLGLLALGLYLVVLPLCGVHVPASAELIGGNYTNVASAVGGCIAAGGALHLVRQERRRVKAAEASHKIVADLYRHQTGKEHDAAPPRALPGLEPA